MRNKAPLALMLALVAGMILAAGCSEGESRAAGKQLREAVEEAAELHEAALELAGSPYYEDPSADERVTYLENPTTEQLQRYRAVSRLEVNPDALKQLDRAEQRLREALGGADAAGEADKALARAMLGRVAILRGQCNARIAENRHVEIYEALGRLRSVAGTVQVRTGLVEFYEQVLGRSDEYVEQMIEQARADVEQFQGELSELDSQLEQWRQQREQLISANEKLYAEARNYRIDSQQAKGTEATELLNEALEAEAERHDNETQISELEWQIEQARADRDRVRIQLESAQGRVETGQEILDARRELVAENDGNLPDRLADLRSQVKQQQSLIDELGAEIVEKLDSLSSVETEAANDFDLAADSFSQAARLAGRDHSPAYLALQGDALVNSAELNDVRLRLRERMDAVLTGDVAPASAVEAPGEYLANVDEVNEAVVSDCEQAVQLYSRAASQAPGDNQWVYDAEVAVTAINLYLFSGQDEHRKTAEDALEKLEDMMDSPQLRPVAELRMKLAGNG
ncbi:MAG: hypothetical protein ACP5HU_08795 [Phycisphaerae bacterium]